MELVLSYLFIFVFVFSILMVLKNVFGFLSALLSNPPKKFQVTSRETLYIGLSSSYIITFIISLFI